jgi:hypothetical protein
MTCCEDCCSCDDGQGPCLCLCYESDGRTEEDCQRFSEEWQRMPRYVDSDDEEGDEGDDEESEGGDEDGDDDDE